MIIVTGGAGFIGSALVWKLNQMSEREIIIVDELGTDDKWKNLTGLRYIDIYHPDKFLELIIADTFPFEIDTIFHLGACSSTTEKDADYLLNNNFRYSQHLAKYAVTHRARFIYASSAATYGDGSMGYLDNERELIKLRPLNMYGYSKHLLDLWMHKTGYNEEVVGLKYFNVFGPNEYHKDDMRSVVHKSYKQILETGSVKLFKSYKEEYKDGEQKRDFIYVKDVVDMTLYFFENRDVNGLFNIGTGKSRSWVDLVTAVFNSMDKPVNIEFIDMPDNLKEKYQYFTEANIDKIKNAGYKNEISSIEDGITDYVKNYLMTDKYLDS